MKLSVNSHHKFHSWPPALRGAGVVQLSGAAVVTCLHAAARTLRAARAVQGEVLSVWQVLHGTPSAPRISAQRVARFDDHCTSNLFINNKLHPRYSRSIQMTWCPLRLLLQTTRRRRGGCQREKARDVHRFSRHDDGADHTL